MKTFAVRLLALVALSAVIYAVLLATTTHGPRLILAVGIAGLIVVLGSITSSKSY